MNLIVKVIDAPGVAGDKALALCSEDGEMLPLQIGCQVVCEMGELSKITASFWIDGEKIRFEA